MRERGGGSVDQIAYAIISRQKNIPQKRERKKIEIIFLKLPWTGTGRLRIEEKGRKEKKMNGRTEVDFLYPLG